jgi:rhamnosyltransferase
VHVLALGCNQGIAAAQNQGIAWAKDQGATHVLLMDQDSVPASNMVLTLLTALEQHPEAGSVGPWYADTRRSKAFSPFVRIQGLKLDRLRCSSDRDVLLVDHLIASGCLIPMRVLAEVGVMREDFFIDFVDIQWCLRVRHAGYSLYGVCAARLEHQLGEKPVNFLGSQYLSHSPERHYFHVRNALLIYRESFVPLQWKLVSAWRLLLKMAFHSMVTAPRRLHFAYMLRGLADGLRGRSGPRNPM